MVNSKRANIIVILYFYFISFCFAIYAIFAPPISKLCYFFFKFENKIEKMIKGLLNMKVKPIF